MRWISYAFVCLIALVGAARTTKAGGGSDELISMVIDAIKSNYSIVKSADVTIREISEDAQVRESETSVFQDPDGSEIRVTRVPRSEWKVRVTVQGDKMRLDRVPAEPGTNFGTESRAVVNGIWTHYTPASSAAWIHRTKNIPGMFPEDPRQLGSDDARRSVIDILQEDRIVSSKLTKSAAGEALVRIVAESKKGVRTIYEFSAKANFLPVRLMTRWPDGSVLQLVQFEYQDVMNGKAKFLKKLTRQFFAKGVTFEPAANGWRQSFIREVKDLVLNEQISPERFEIQMPPRTRISDNVRQVIYRAAVLPNPDKKRRWPYTVALIGVIVALVSLRTRRHIISTKGGEV